MSEIDYSRDICDFCQFSFKVEKKPHTCAQMPIEHLNKFIEYFTYEDLVGCFGQIIISVTDNDYQGDTRYLLRGPDQRLGFLVNGWGSCSSCDALEGCNNLKEYDDLRNGLGSNIHWFETEKECLEYFQNKDWETEFYYGSETQQFIEQTLAYLTGVTNGKHD